LIPIALAARLASMALALPQVAAGPPSAAYMVDAAWPGPLPGDWILGQVSGIAVDREDHVWILQRPASLTVDEGAATLPGPPSSCCRPAPPVLVFDQAGHLLRAWGGPGKGYDWPRLEHSIFVDDQGFVWVDGCGATDGQLLKFTSEGRFVLQIGHPGPPAGSNDVTCLGRPAGIWVDGEAREVYVADGYANHRVIVFDAVTGAYRRHWGAYGERPPEGPGDRPMESGHLPDGSPSVPPPHRFGNPVHSVRMSRDRLLYVCDRVNGRIQVFRPDGTFREEFFLGSGTAAPGQPWDLVFSRDPGQTRLIVIDGLNNQLVTLDRRTGKELARQGRQGRQAGQFHWAHDIEADSRGNLYIGEVDTGKRVQKFMPAPGN
jgi:DNA-binding beta-propeller fold protein YncE